MPNFFRMLKCWEGEAPFVIWQLAPLRKSSEIPKKFYLILDAKKNAPLSFTTEKREALKTGGAFVNLFRKYVRGGVLGPILRDKETKSIWLLFQNKQEIFYVLFPDTKPREFQLIDAQGDTIVRRSTTTTYTKKRQFSGALPHPSDYASGERFTDLSEDLLHHLLDATTSDDPGSANSLGPQTTQPAPDSFFPAYQRDSRKRLARKLKTVQKYLRKLERITPTNQEIDRQVQELSLLQNFVHRVREGDIQVTLDPFETGLATSCTITLDPEATPGKNIDQRYHRLKKSRRAVEIGRQQLLKTYREIQDLEDSIARLQSQHLTHPEIDEILERYKIPRVKQSPTVGAPAKTPYRAYLSKAGYMIWVGKGAKENDQLTKGARANDFWLHAVGVSGSHVIIPSHQLKGTPNADLIRESAILALHYSKVKNDQAGEVYIARRCDIRKPKGMPPGLWKVEKAKTMFFRYSGEDLQAVLNRVQR